MYCSKCGKKNSASAMFCCFCGSEILPPPDEEPSGMTTAAEVPVREKFEATPARADMQAPVVAPPPAVESERKKRISTGWVILLTLLGVAIVAGIAWFTIKYVSGWFSFGNESEPPVFAPTETQQAATVPTVTSTPYTNRITTVPKKADSPTPTPTQTQPPEKKADENTTGKSKDDDLMDLPKWLDSIIKTNKNETRKLESENFKSANDFIDALCDGVWTYYERFNNPQATSINGGFADMDGFDNYGSANRLFHTDGSFEWPVIYKDPSITGVGQMKPTQEDRYHVEWLNNMWVAYFICPDQAIYHNHNCTIRFVYTIDKEFGILMENLCLYDEVMKELIFISNVNYYKLRDTDDKNSGTGTHDASAVASWDNQQDFIDALQANSWKYSYCTDMPSHFEGPWAYNAESIGLDDEYIFILTFKSNGKLLETRAPTNGGSADTLPYNYELSTGEAWVQISPAYYYDGNDYEWWLKYFINLDGNLVSRNVLYDTGSNYTYLYGKGDVFTPLSGDIEF